MQDVIEQVHVYSICNKSIYNVNGGGFQNIRFNHRLLYYQHLK